MIGETTYCDLLTNCRSFNKRIGDERRCRMPFLDAQTRVAQNASQLYRKSAERRRCKDGGADDESGGGVVYRYPAKNWRKKSSTDSSNLLTSDLKFRLQNSTFSEKNDCNENSTNNEDSEPRMNLEFKSESNDGSSRLTAASEQAQQQQQQQALSQIWYDESTDPTLDDPYFDEPAAPFGGQISDGEDYEEKSSRKKKSSSSRKKGQASRSRRQIDESEKTHVCMHCGAKYKTKPGLHYHLTHVHPEVSSHPQPPVYQQPPSAQYVPAPTQYQPLPELPPLAFQNVPPAASEQSTNKDVEEKKPPSNGQFCDFCLGDARENKKTARPEELIACKDCGRCGHPTCLQFTPNMIVSTKRHGWQCIDCKSCAVCGTSENDDQLLFCDDCDRGFHMYCLKPPLRAAPEGNWSCHLCISEFGAAASNPSS